MNLSAIVSQFVVEADLASIMPYGSGHINDSYYIKNKHDQKADYLLQRINHAVFKDVPCLMRNVYQVTTYMREKLETTPGADPGKEVLSLIVTHDSRYYYIDPSGNYWRMYKFIKNSKSADIVQTRQQAFEGGRAIGKFQTLLLGLDINLLGYTIPDFHHIGTRLFQLETALLNDIAKRKKQVVNEVKFIQDRISAMSGIMALGKDGKLPLRVTHNDTKFNNILFNQNKQAQCVIDLDTVMPGYVAFDFGDAIRTLINTAAEDEKNLDQIALNMPLFESFTKGYLQESVDFLTENEIKSLPMAVLLFPYMQAVRFLTDYLNGDVYYKTHFVDQNLQRTRAQLKLLEKLENSYDYIEDFVWTTTNHLIDKQTEWNN